MMRRLAQRGLIALATAGVLWVSSSLHDVTSEGPLVHAYCAYGAVSRVQLRACERRVSPDHIRRLDTPAAEYARAWTAPADPETGEPPDLPGCGPGSGPFCGTWGEEGPRTP